MQDTVEQTEVNPWHVPIAICGIGLRLPGGLRTPSDLYDLLVGKKDGKTTVPKERFDVDAYYNASDPKKAGSLATPFAYFIDEDLSLFDTSMFGMSNAEVASTDPSQRLLLEVTREAFESAGEANFRGTDVGTFVGDFTTGWEDLQDMDFQHTAAHRVMGKTDFVLPNRIAFEYDLLGPSVLIKTACSATAGALNSAVLAIHSGSCSSAIVAGANLILTPRASIEMSALGVLAPDGDCKTFDAKANGFARGESACALYVKPFRDAVRDGNPIRAVIRACNSNADGGDGSRTFGTPNAAAQEALIRHTYASAGLSLAETKVIELHGTGTPVGDPLETAAIAQCFGGGPEVYIGSIKPNLGHGEGASSMASIIKAVLALESRTVIPNIKFNEPNPKIPWNRNLVVPTEPLPWPAGVHERMSINSFGLGGSNVHIVLDSAASFGAESRHLQARCQPDVRTDGKRLLLLSGNSDPSIMRLAEGYRDYLSRYPQNLDAMVYTLAQRRERLSLGSYCIVNGSKISEATKPISSKNIQQVVFIFTGQGAQWVGMGREMIEENKHFAACIQGMDKVLQSLEHPPTWTLKGLLMSDKAETNLFSSTEISQPVSTAIQIAYVDTLAAWGITPTAIIGHSSGEVASAYAAGALTSREAIITSYYRGYACAHNKLFGGMAAVGMSREDVEPYLQPGVVLACDNSNASVTLSGDLTGLQSTMETIKQHRQDVFVRQLRVPMAYHSSHMSTVADLYHSLIAHHLSPQATKIPWYSTVYGKKMTEAVVADSQYFIHNMERPALFRTAALQLLQDLGDNMLHLEIGPHSALAGPLRQIYQESGLTPPYVAVAERGKDAAESFLHAIGKSWSLGLKPAIPKATDAFTLPDLPTYPWHYDGSHWTESRLMTDYRNRKHRKHELLGLRVLESSDIEPVWRNLLKISDAPWLADHCVENDIVFPAAGYVAMAGAAVGQLTSSTAYTVREVHIATAMLIADQGTKEVITSLRKRDWTLTTASKWWDFTIVSHSNGTWTKHCWGLVTDGSGIPQPSLEAKHYSRHVDSKRWYDTMANVGLKYGPLFRGLYDITASPVGQAAKAKVADHSTDPNAYALHPSTMDMVLQSQGIALAQGQYCRFNSLWLPTFIGEFYVSDKGTLRTLDVYTSSAIVQSSAIASSYGMVDEELAYVLRGLKGAKMTNSGEQQETGQGYLSLEWHPSIDFVRHDTLIRPTEDVTYDLVFLDRLSLMCAAEIQYEAKGITSFAQPHFARFMNSMETQLCDEHWQSFIPDAAELIAMSHEQRQTEIAVCRGRSKGTRFENVVEVMWRVCSNIVDILEGRRLFLDIALEDGALPGFYNESNSLSDVQDWFVALGTSKPYLRILEIGAGTGGTTACVLQALQSRQKERLYQTYTITDVSAGFLSQCRERFNNYSDLKYAMLDISADPVQQGFEPESFDLIIASNVLHATPNLRDTLSNCRALLKPDGYLFLQELCSANRCIDLTMGLFDGWWIGVEDGRPDRAPVTVQTWDSMLRQSGFSGAETAVCDNTHPRYFMSANIISRPAVTTVEPRRVTLLLPKSEKSAFGEDVKAALACQGWEIDECVWGQDHVPSGQHVVSLIDVEPDRGALLANIHDTELDTLIKTITDVSGSILLWLMPPAQIGCSDPQYGQILGMARCIRAELGVDFVTLELDSFDSVGSQVAARLLAQQNVARNTRSTLHDDPEPDSEFVWRDGQMLISRMHMSSVADQLSESAQVQRAKHLVITQPGMLQTMYWAGHDLPPLAPDFIQVRMTHVGLNFHDVAVAMGIMEPEHMDDDGYHGLGCEGSGIVTAVGQNVDHIAVGDRVMGLGIPNGTFATEIQLSGPLCIKIPDNLTLTDGEASSLLIPYLTVLWSLLEKARLKRGQTLLIHSAAGGVGIAAIHIARWLGADFYCTVGSSAKIDFLVKELNVPRQRIFHSRNDSFVESVLQATHGRGVDYVLNSLSGELLHASWQCVAPGGYMLDLGKRDFLGRGRLDMFPFAGNRAFFGIDVAEIVAAKPTELSPYLRLIVRLLQDGSIFALRPTTDFEAHEVSEAFRYMQKGVHVGRISVRIPADTSALVPSSSSCDPQFRSDGVYLLAGGLGGLGQSIISWMVRHGARSFVAVSPSAGSRKEHKDLIKELREQNCELLCVAGDIADADVVRHVIATTGRPINGLVQLAMALCDTGFLNMDHRSWTTATAPKIQGTWNLHTQLPKDMDFFIMCSSASGIMGSYGQSNYAAANTYLDSFVQFRHSLGLPASVMDIMAIGDVGYVASNKDVAERVEKNISRYISEAEFLQCFKLSLQQSSPRSIKEPGSQYKAAAQIILLNEMTHPLADSQNAFPWRADPRISIFRINQGSVTGESGQEGENLRSFLLALSSQPEKLEDPATSNFLAEKIAERVSGFLMVEGDASNTSRTLTTMGADSLVAIEIRNWWRQTFGVEVSALELADPSNTMEALGKLAVHRLKERYFAQVAAS
ncbi:Mycolipanoate synthase [Ascochyta lentis]